MAISVVQSASSTNLSSGTTAGNCVIIAAGNNSSSVAPSAPKLGGSTGNFTTAVVSTIYGPDSNSHYSSVAIFYDPSCAGGQTTISGTGFGVYDVYEISGLGACTVDTSGSNGATTGSSFTVTAGGATTAAVEFWVICTVAVNLSNAYSPAPYSSPWTAGPFDSYYQITSSTGTPSGSGSGFSSIVRAGVIAAFKPAPGPVAAQSVNARQAVKRAAYY